jgi:hypothetical protein
MYLKIVSLLTALASTVSAHGYIDNITIAGTTYVVSIKTVIDCLVLTLSQSYQPYTDPYWSPAPPDRITRPIQGNGPVQDLTLIDLQCGGYTAGGVVGSQPAKLTGGPVAAGSTVSLKWTLWPDSHAGPVITYMAKCPSAGCTSYSPGTACVYSSQDMRKTTV